MGPSARRLFDEIALCMTSKTGDAGARLCLYRRIVAAMQSGNHTSIVEAHAHVSWRDHPENLILLELPQLNGALGCSREPDARRRVGVYELINYF